MRLICEHSYYPFTSAGWTLPPTKLIHQIFLAMKVLKLNTVLLVVVVIMKNFLVVIWVSQSLQNNKLNQLNLVLRAAVHSDDDELNSSRLENLHWCTCHHCTVMPTFIECKCCEEFPDLLKDKLDDACITDHKGFDVLCLHNSVLETAFIRHRRYKNNYTDAKEMTLKYAVVN